MENPRLHSHKSAGLPGSKKSSDLSSQGRVQWSPQSLFTAFCFRDSYQKFSRHSIVTIVGTENTGAATAKAKQEINVLFHVKIYTVQLLIWGTARNLIRKVRTWSELQYLEC